MAYYNTNFNIEGFTQKKLDYVLMGDSVLNNYPYVKEGKSVTDLLKDNTSGKVLCLAKNNATISQVYLQVDNIPYVLDSTNTTIFLSIGGNDILDKSEQGDLSIDSLFDNYIKLVKTIKSIVPKPTLILFDIYYPKDDKYAKYYSIVQQWNTMLYNFVLENNLKMFKISAVLTESTDFKNGIEVSTTGSEKLVDALLKV
jgi:lysophospholipase L1-like esterase